MVDLDAPTRHRRALEQTEHRPWPPPRRGWLLGQTVNDLVAAHWRVPAADVRGHVPAELELDLHDDSAWVSVVAFRVSGLRVRGTLPLPGLSSFLQVNVRTYVTDGDKPGVWFFSLDASSRVAVEVARRSFRLPFFHARISATRDGGWTGYECARLGTPGRVFSGRCRPAGAVSRAAAGSLDWFLTERYCLYTTGERGALCRGEIHHDLWPLQRADAEIELASLAPLELRGEPVCHFARRHDLLVWPLERLA